MALVSSGALHSCEDHLQYPRSLSSARLESLSFIRAQNGNASNSSVLCTTTSFIFSFPFPQLWFLSPLCHRRGKFLCLAPLAHLAYFSASALCRESAPLSSTLPPSLPLSLSCFYHYCISAATPAQTPSSIYSLHCLEKSKIFERSLLRLTSYSASTRECLFSIFFCHLSPSVLRQWSKPGQGTSFVMGGWKVGLTMASKNKTNIHFKFVLILYVLMHYTSVSCVIKQWCKIRVITVKS